MKIDWTPCAGCGCVNRCVEFGMGCHVPKAVMIGCAHDGQDVLIDMEANGASFRVWWDQARKMAAVFLHNGSHGLPVSGPYWNGAYQIMGADTLEEIAEALPKLDAKSRTPDDPEHIPVDKMVDKVLYVCRARNFTVGIWHDGRMYGLRRKWNDTFVDTELHYDEGAPHGTCVPLLKISAPLDRLEDGDFGSWRGGIVLSDVLSVAEKVLAGLDELSDDELKEAVHG